MKVYNLIFLISFFFSKFVDLRKRKCNKAVCITATLDSQTWGSGGNPCIDQNPCICFQEKWGSCGVMRKSISRDPQEKMRSGGKIYLGSKIHLCSSHHGKAGPETVHAQGSCAI